MVRKWLSRAARMNWKLLERNLEVVARGNHMLVADKWVGLQCLHLTLHHQTCKNKTRSPTTLQHCYPNHTLVVLYSSWYFSMYLHHVSYKCFCVFFCFDFSCFLMLSMWSWWAKENNKKITLLKIERRNSSGILHLERVWQCGCGCFSNNFSCRNTCQWFFFIFLKSFLTSAHQNDSKSTNRIQF